MALPRAQELTEFITFNSVSGERDAVTKRGTASAVFATAWARIKEGGGAVDVETMQHLGQAQDFEIITQYIDGVNGFMEITWGSRVLTMSEPPQKIFDANHRAWMIIQAQEIIEQQVS